MYCLKTSLLLLFLITNTTLQAAGPVYFSGEINRQSVGDFLSQHRDSSSDTLIVNSEGGEVDAAIDLGLWIHEKKLNVVVKGFCLSSCANYIFTAGHRKTVTEGSIVAWHGNYHHLDKTGLWRDDVKLRMRRDKEDEATATRTVRAQVEHLLAREKTFFEKTGVNEFLCWVGKLPPHKVPDYFTMSAQDMARFGVDEVSLPDVYPSKINSGAYIDMRFIKLQSDN